MSNKSHIFQVWERDNQDFIVEGPRNKLVATLDTRTEAEQFVHQQNLEKMTVLLAMTTHTIKRVHRNKVK